MKIGDYSPLLDDRAEREDMLVNSGVLCVHSRFGSVTVTPEDAAQERL